MASPSDDPPSSAPAERPQNPVSVEPTNDGRPDTNVETVKESSPPSVFVNSEPIREDQVQNAMKFLSHPKVRGSPVMYRRSFLERKGLTKEEIDEAFRRVPDTMTTDSTTQPAVPSQDGPLKPPSKVQQQPATQVLQPGTVVPAGSTSRIGILPQFHWYHAILAVGFLAASGAGTAVFFKKSVVPRLKSWIRKVASEEDDESLTKKDAKPSAAEEAAAAAKSAAAAAADVARASQEMLTTKREEKRCFEELISMLNAQVLEMKTMSNSIQKLESGQSVNGRNALEEQYNPRFSGNSARQPYANGKTDTDARSVRSSSPPMSVEPSSAAPPHPKSYMEIMEMIQRGEKPSNIRDINDAPPNPNQPLPNSRSAPRPKPWEINQSQNSSSNTYPSQESNNGVNYNFQDNQPNGDEAGRWWEKKNVRITDIEGGEEQKFGSSNMAGNERPPAQRSSWVPPQPPPVVIPEAATAIRQPKKAINPTEPMSDDQFLAHSVDAGDELQKITRFSETGGSVEANTGISDPLPAEIPMEENGSYLEA